MVEGTQTSLAAAEGAGVRRFVLMSALGTDERSKDLVPYYGAKWEMERSTRDSGLEHVIFRPSFVFGRDGGVLPIFVRQVRWSPVTPVIGDGQRRIQPIWVDDVAAYFAKAVDLPEAANRTFELGGPDLVTWNELCERIARTLGKRRARMHVPVSIMRTGGGRRAASGAADHARPADDARGRRQRLRPGTGAGDVRARRRPARRADPARRLRTRRVTARCGESGSARCYGGRAPRARR